MTDDALASEPPEYGRAARLRLAMSELAADISDYTRGMVPTGSDRHTHAGEWVEQAARVLSDARELLALTVAYERHRGTSWEDIGEVLGISRQAAHERYAARTRQLDDDLVLCWVAGDPPQYPGLPTAAAAPAEHAAILDRWAADHLPGAEDDRHGAVSDGLPPMTTLEHATMVIAAGAILSKRTTAGEPIPRELEVGYARRKVELYERLIADETERPGSTGTTVDQLRDQHTGARARLAELEGDELAARRAPGPRRPGPLP